ncbi:MAG: hypothetical protein M1831_007130 [Alyxoria varia]|nr:MAG: hypothetical protein M1831_007130 [Alyxoria varia]
MEANAAPHNGPEPCEPPGTTTTSSEAADQLSKPLDRLSLGTSSKPSPLAVHTDPANSGSSPRRSSAMASPGAGSKQFPSSPRASVGPGPASSPGSPRLNRKSSSPMLSRSENQHTPSRPSSRRVASSTTSLRTTALQQAQAEEEKPPLTAASVASDYFKKEMALHSGVNPPHSDTIVIVHDSCYGHRYARSKTSKANLSLIVERPERIQASVAGVASAYVRLGGRHAAGGHAPHPRQEADSAIPFRIQKSSRTVSLTDTIISNVHGSKRMQELGLMCQAAQTRLNSGEKELSRPSTPTGGSSTTSKSKLHEGDLYLCGESLNAFQSAIGGVCDGVDAVFNDDQTGPRKAFVCIRPPGHHCSAELPSGFCWLNNVHVGIEYAAQKYGLTHAAIIDFDLHHGDGSQSIAWERNTRAAKAQRSTSKTMQQSKKTSVGYFSLHDINSYPCEEGAFEKVNAASVCIENAHGQSIWNVHLQPWSTEAEFWELYETKYLKLLDKARAFLRLQTQRVKSSSASAKPRGAIFLSAGFDASQWEMEMMQRHKVNVPTEFYARFTADVLKMAQEEDSSVNTRVISVLEGGYSDRALTSGVLSHLTGLTRSVGDHANAKGTVDGVHELEKKSEASWDSRWWSPETLAELESLNKPPPPPPAPKKPRNTEVATYASPTQSFTAKVVDPTKVYRSLSGAEQNVPKSRPPTPPPPDVDWAVASHEFTKLLVPNDRQIDSFKHEELNEPRVKRERHSSIGLPSAAPPADRQLRGRKPKMIGSEEIQLPTASEKEQSKAGRRRTISSLPSMSEDASEEPSVPIVPSIEPSDRPQSSASNFHPNKPSAGSSTASSTSAKAQQAPASRAPANAVSMPKTRRASTAKAEMKPPPISRRSSTQSKREDTIDTTSRTQSSQDVDELTSQVKKITLRMPNNEAEDVKTSKPTTTTTHPAKAPRKPPVSKIGRPTAGANAGRPKKTVKPTNAIADNASASSLAQAAKPSHQSAPVQDPGQPNNNINDAHKADTASQGSQSGAFTTAPTSQDQSTLMKSSIPDNIDPMLIDGPSRRPEDACDNPDASARLSASHSATQKEETRLSAHHEFVPYVPQSSAAGSHSQLNRVQQEPLTWLPPNVTSTPPNLKSTGTPSYAANAVETTPSKRNKENLPVFSAKGFIPFSKNASLPNSGRASAAPSGTKRIDPSGGDETNSHSQTNSEASKEIGSMPGEGGPINGTDLGNNEQKQDRPGGSVWDVPETPKR